MRRGAAIAALALAALTVPAGSTTTASAFLSHSIVLSGPPPRGFVQRQAVDWCGASQPTAFNRTPETDLSSTRQVHVTYAIPIDGFDQFAALASRIATDAAAMDAWWRGHDATRTLRLDTFAFPGCATKAGRLDLGFVRLPRVGNLYVGDAGVDRLLGDLIQVGSLPSDKHLVYYDGPNVFDEFTCGTAFVPRSAPTNGGLAGIAFVWLRSLCGGDLGAGRLNAAVAVHELIHGLGALVEGAPPNECPPPNDGHVCDSTTDVLYPEANASTTIATQILDFGRDDYYGHSSSWFDVQDSGWLTHLPQHRLTISTQQSGRASGSVRVTSPSALDCGKGCSLELDSGVGVVLTAAPAAGTRFVGWRGSCAGTGACTITIDASKTVTAVFAVAVVRVSAAVTGKGKVTSTPAGISCPGRCSASFQVGTSVRLKATPARGQAFAGWSGSCRGKGACVVTANSAKSARATFRKKG